ncbi:hypothetical protein F2Q68_00017837 [Brassica cretica]|uniref:Uncharacterized protein n=1 Tax=Brassica cretica TaxID=69181 RepID=A0A8S9HPF5_BRACR|nr:hypothetical protein F2Q68_00017837 [Brassica cretica]
MLCIRSGLQHRKNSWQDGVTGTSCPIPPGTNYTYHFQPKDQIGSYFYYPSTALHRFSGGFGGLRVNSRLLIPVPYADPEDDYTVLINDWYTKSHTALKTFLDSGRTLGSPDGVLINGKSGKVGGPNVPLFTMKPGKTYKYRICNVGFKSTLNFRIQGHKMKLVEMEGSHVLQNDYDSLDVHVGQCFAVLVTADQTAKNYYMVASTRFLKKEVSTVGVMSYEGSNVQASSELPKAPVGWACGYVITSLILLLKSKLPNVHYLATDTNPIAARVTTETLEAHGVKAEIICTDIASCLEERLAGSVDVMVVNPPYVPTPEYEVGMEGIASSWAGGENGRSVIDRMLPVVDRLLSEKGWFYLVTLTSNYPSEICLMMRKRGFAWRILVQRSTEEENLVILKFWRDGDEESLEKETSTASLVSEFSRSLTSFMEKQRRERQMTDQGLEGSNPVDLAEHPSGIVPTLQNIVSTVNLDCKLDLKAIALQARNAEYNPKRFAAVIMRIREPKTTALIFASGKMVCTGAKSEYFSKMAARKVAFVLLTYLHYIMLC